MAQSLTDITVTVIAITDATHHIKSISLAHIDGAPLPTYTPGAHIDIVIGEGEIRSYSLMPPITENSYTLGILLEENSAGGSVFMHGLKIGDTLEITPPKNDFPLAKKAVHSLLFAGGIGITPIFSMAEALLKKDVDFSLHYAGRTEKGLAFINALQNSIGDKLQLHFDDCDTALDIAAVLKTTAPDTHIYVCGPKGMIEAVQRLADAAGFPKDQVHFELFNSPATQTGDSAFEIEIASSGKTYTVPSDKTIIEILEDAGEDPIYDCARGDCGICQTGVLSGDIDHRDVVLSDAEKAAGDMMQICVSRAKSGKLVLDL